MSSTTVAPSQQLNGVSAVPPELLREADFLDKLLQIRDAVFASKHPRIHLPPNVLEHVAPRPTQQPTPPSASRPTTNGTPTSHQPLQLFPPRSESSLQQSQAPNEYSSPAHAAPRSFSAKSASSGIDPVLLTKSDHLIRAELQLKRQQIERAIKDQFDRKGRANDTSVEDRETHFDVEDVLIKAQALVEPVSGLQSTANNSESSESFDENSYYSSQANSWSSEEINSNQTAHGADIAEPLTPQANRSAFDAQLTAAKLASHPEPATKRVEPAVIDLDEEPYEPADDIEIYEPEPAKVPEEDEDEDYSPPPADVVGPSGPNRGRQRDRGNEGHSGMNGYDNSTFLLSVLTISLLFISLSKGLRRFFLCGNESPGRVVTPIPNFSATISACPLQLSSHLAAASTSNVLIFNQGHQGDKAQLDIHLSSTIRESVGVRKNGGRNGVNKQTSVLSALPNRSLKKNLSLLRLSQVIPIHNLVSAELYSPFPMTLR